MYTKTSITIMFLFSVLFLNIFLVKDVNATTFYVTNNSALNSGWSTGAKSNNGLSRSAPFATLVYALKQMSGGDTLIIANGTYTGVENILDANVFKPEGTPSAYTVIKAENDGGVVIDGEGIRIPLVLFGNDTVDGDTGFLASQDYFEIRGIISANSSGSGMLLKYVNHVKIINCGVVEAMDGNNVGFYASYSSYILFEGSYAWGSARYKFATYHSDHVVLRNLVARMDRTDPQGEVIADYSIYQSTNVEVQNVISIDGDQDNYYKNVAVNGGSFTVPMTAPDTKGTGPVNFVNCMGLNMTNRFGIHAWNLNKPADAHFNNCFGWDYRVPPDGFTDFIHSQGSTAINQSTFGEVSTLGGTALKLAWFNGWKPKNVDSTTNNIWYNFSNGGLFYDVETSSYNNIYGLDSGASIDVYGTSSSNTNSIDPKNNGLKYLPRIETASTLDTAGQGGVRIGAVILKQYGKSGTLWGEPGYNLLQDGTNGQDDVNLWPFPNESLIREKMKAYSYDNGNLTGDRGFAVDGQTLSNYIWGYLGNTVPPFNVNASSGDRSVTLTWDSPAPIALPTITGYKIYNVTSDTVAFVAGSGTLTATVSGLSGDTSYEFYVTAVDSIKGESSYSYKISATPTGAGIPPPPAPPVPSGFKIRKR